MNKFCDCNQGRLDCTCKSQSAQYAGKTPPEPKHWRDILDVCTSTGTPSRGGVANTLAAIPPAVGEFAVSERDRLLAQISELRAELQLVRKLFNLRENDDGLWVHLQCEGKNASINLNTIHTARWFVAAYCSKNPRVKP